jgi:Dyp-type peroxidase family
MKKEKERKLVNRDDIQGIVASGYDHLDYSRFVFLKIKCLAETRKWLTKIVPLITNARHPGEKKSGVALNIAFSFKGLETLVPNRLQDFPHEFERGMNTDDANLILGDQDESDPKHWDYGAQDQPELHVLVMLYGATDQELESLHHMAFGYREFADGLSTIAQQDSVIPPGDETEPFGFRDGISQPPIRGLVGQRVRVDSEPPINTGEFVLGYENELGLLTRIPSVDNWADPHGYLAEHPNYPGARRGFGLNGTYLVFRKLLQKVDEFWKYIDESSKDVSCVDPKRSRELLAAKMMGRWRSGAPLVLSPETPGAESRNDFLYMTIDRDGQRCPIGSHIRRANPRDSLDMPPSRSILISRRHRIVRRGRKFAEPANCNNPKVNQGLFFIALNADLRRQFEFIQQLWINDPSFNGLDNDKDPIAGNNDGYGEFTIQAKPFNHHIQGLPRFVTVGGGGYFFLPGINALGFLANYQP